MSAIPSALPSKAAPAKRGRSAVAAAASGPLAYNRGMGVDTFLRLVHEATPLQIVDLERRGIAGSFIGDLSKRMDIPASRMMSMLRIPKATAARKTSVDTLIDGRAGQATVGMVKLLSLAQEIVDDSTAPGAAGFDTVKWLGQWVERPQPALGGGKPADFLDTPTGVALVARVLGSLQSGAFL